MIPTATSQDDISALARSSLGGKKTNTVKAAVSDELKELLERRLRQIRLETGRVTSESEYVEKVLAISLLGFEHVLMVEQEQLKKLAGFWSPSSQLHTGDAK